MTTARTRRNACVGGKNKGSTKNRRKLKMQVYQAINKIQAELAACGITKDRRNQAQGFNFRGIDDVYNALSPLLSKHGLCILPRMISRRCDERVNNKGTTLLYVTVEAEFDFVSAEDGSSHVVRTFGEAMDSGDKATNKAMSAAYKYAAFQAFAIPTEGDNDADAHTHSVQPSVQKTESFDVAAACEWIAMADTAEEAKQRGRQVWPQANKADHPKITAAVQAVEQRTKQAA